MVMLNVNVRLNSICHLNSGLQLHVKDIWSLELVYNCMWIKTVYLNFRVQLHVQDIWSLKLWFAIAREGYLVLVTNKRARYAEQVLLQCNQF